MGGKIIFKSFEIRAVVKRKIVFKFLIFLFLSLFQFSFFFFFFQLIDMFLKEVIQLIFRHFGKSQNAVIFLDEVVVFRNVFDVGREFFYSILCRSVLYDTHGTVIVSTSLYIIAFFEMRISDFVISQTTNMWVGYLLSDGFLEKLIGFAFFSCFGCQ